MPGLRRAAASLARGYRGHPADLQAEILTGFLTALRALHPGDLEDIPLASRLCWAAWRAGRATHPIARKTRRSRSDRDKTLSVAGSA